MLTDLKTDPKAVENLVEIITHEVLAAMLEQQEKAAGAGRRAVQVQLRRRAVRAHLLRPGREGGQRRARSGFPPPSA